ncbi:MAG: HAD family hydrolase [Candidatus Korarchaeota archaeon]
MIKIISYDLDGTLIKMDFANTFWFQVVPEVYAKKYGMAFDEAKKRVVSEYDKIGPSDLRWYDPVWWFKYFKLDFPVESAIQEAISRGTMQLFDDALPSLKMARSCADAVIVTTLQPHIFLKYTSVLIKDYVDAIWSTTSDVGRPLKDAETFKAIAAQYNAKMNMIAHVGDNIENDYLLPRKAGVHAFLLDRTKRQNGEHFVGDLIEFVRKVQYLEVKL